MSSFRSFAARQSTASGLARIARECRRAASATALLGLMMTAGGCAGLTPTQDRIAGEDPGGRVAQVMRMADSVRAGGDASAAAVFYRRAHALAPERLEPLVGLAQSAAALGANEEAAQLYRQAVALAPDNAQLRLGFGRVLLALDRPDLAIGELRAAVAADPGDYRAYLALGVALDLSCDQPQAQQVYRDGLGHNPDNLSLRNNLALSLALAGDNDQAIAMLRDLSRELGAGPRVRQNLALVYALSGRGEDAAAMAQRDFAGARLRHNLALYDSLRGMSGPRFAADVVCGGEPAGPVYSSFAPEAGSPRAVAFAEEASPREEAPRLASFRGAKAGGNGPLGAIKVKSAVEGGTIAAPDGAGNGESAAEIAPTGDADPASYTVRQGDTLSKIAKKYYGSGRKYLALMEANRATLAHPDKIYPGMVVHIPALG